jgi:D-glycero-D-manno-heptose 1,7-bisphosphate phosphatase
MRMIWSRQRSASATAIFIDRDGVINCRRANDYVLDWSQFVFVDGIREALRELASLGLPMILISNQSAVGRGLLSSVELEDITQRMWKTLEQDGTRLSAAYFCPHRPDEKCSCRKPQPGLLTQAAADFGIDLSRSVLIGDSDADVKAAQAVGCHAVLFGAGHTACSDSLQWMNDLPVAHTAKDLFQVTVGVLRKATPRVFSVDVVSPGIS